MQSNRGSRTEAFRTSQQGRCGEAADELQQRQVVLHAAAGEELHELAHVRESTRSARPR